MIKDIKQCGPRKFGRSLTTSLNWFSAPSPESILFGADSGRMSVIFSVIAGGGFEVGPARYFDSTGLGPFRIGNAGLYVFKFDEYGPVVNEEWIVDGNAGSSGFSILLVTWQ